MAGSHRCMEAASVGDDCTGEDGPIALNDTLGTRTHPASIDRRLNLPQPSRVPDRAFPARSGGAGDGGTSDGGRPACALPVREVEILEPIAETCASAGLARLFRRRSCSFG